MRSGNLTRLAALTGAVFLTGACASAGDTATPSGPDAMIRQISAAWATASPARTDAEVTRPPAMEPVQVPPPKLSEHTYVFPVKNCAVKYAHKLLVLPKSTIWAKRGCVVVSPVNGRVHEVNTTDRWSPATDRGTDREGLFVTVLGDDGVLYLGGHLDSVAEGIEPGAKVAAGRPLGRVGDSGDARGKAPNLYFAITWKTDPAVWWVRRGMVRPWDYLDAWRDGNRTLSPSPEVAALRRKLGEKPECTVLCASRVAPPPPAPPTPEPTKKPKPRPKRTPDVSKPLNPIGG